MNVIAELGRRSLGWVILRLATEGMLPETTLQARRRHCFRPARCARLNIFPDGGIGRLRLFGRLRDAA